MNSYNEKLLKLENLGKEFLDLSYNTFGWKETYVNKLGNGEYTISDDLNTTISRLYFSSCSNHRDFSFGKKLSIGYFNPVHFNIVGYIDLDEVYSEYSLILDSVKKNLEKISKEEIEQKKQDLISSLEFLLNQLK